MNETLEFRKKNYFHVFFRSAGTRAVRRFIPMMWIDQVKQILSPPPPSFLLSIFALLY